MTISLADQYALLKAAKAAVYTYTSKRFSGYFTAEELEDIVGNTLYKACRSFGSYNPKYALSTWVSRIAVNCVFDAAIYKRNHIPISQSMIEMDEDGDECNVIDIYGCTSSDYEADRYVDYEEFDKRITAVTESIGNDTDKRFFCMIMEGLPPRKMAELEGCSSSAAAIRKCNLLKSLKGPIRDIAIEFEVHNSKLAC